MITVEKIREARVRLGDSIKRTPCAVSSGLSEVCGGDVWLKLENLQVTGSFKPRGAGNKMMIMQDEGRRRGVICASAGNHAQGVAYHAQRLGMKAVIVMPAGTPLIKITRTQSYGAEVVLFGDTFDDASAEARRLCEAHGYLFIHAYDDDDVIAGQGTVGFEIAEQFPDIDTLLIPVGGGGVIAGAAVALKSMKPQVRIIGVEASLVPSMKRALEQGAPVQVPAARTIAEGIAVREVGQRTMAHVKELVDDIVLVDDDEIARAIVFLLERDKTVSEGAGAAAVAALLSKRFDARGKHVCAFVSGGNIDVNVLSRIIERGLVESGRLGRLEVLAPDRPGALAEMLSVVAKERANVVEVHHERAFGRGGLGQVLIEIVVETRGHENVNAIMAGLRERGFDVTPHARA